jgi:hypothetical protein
MTVEEIIKELAIKPDMVFIDGDHSYESVKIDLEKWKDAPFLCGHDATWYTVRQALDEFDRDIALVEGTDIWYATS